MSFNYLEVARAAQMILADFPVEVQSVEMVEFALPGGLPDLNVGLRLNNKRMIVFSLRNRWTALFYSSPGAWRASKQTWASAFSGAQDWNVYLKGQTIQSIAVPENERVVELRFANEAVLKIELFPARPDWVLTVGGQEYRWHKPRPAREKTDTPVFTRPSVLREFERFEGRDWSARAQNHYLVARQAALLTTQLQRAQSQLQARLGQLIKVRGQMMGALAESSKAEFCKQQGERLKALIYQHPKTFRGARIEDIELDPKLSLADNSTKLFSRYKKLLRTKKEVEARLGGIEESSKKITAATAKIRAFKPLESEPFDQTYTRLTALLTESGIAMTGAAVAPDQLKKTDRKWQESGLKAFQSKEGLRMWVGRNHVENEELVIRMARGNDLWMHLKGKPGAHLVIQLPQGKSPSLETLLDGATLVAYYSGVPNSDKAEIDYTYRKYVKRVPGTKEKFLVTYTQNKTIMLKVEEERLWRLLKQHSF